ncbi:MAG: hypothetical protein EA397_18015 [Deltaproteobacteria bacterium]|nr:MAG: hypothetical protein EA397_18015 [Deltaproteobacteria bacterium]
MLRDNSRILGGGSLEAEIETEQRVEGVSGLVLEYLDDPLVDAPHLLRWWEGYAFIAYTSAYHQRAQGERPPGPRWRVIVPFERTVTLKEARRIAQWALHPRRTAGSLDEAVARPARVVALPALVPGGFEHAFQDGAPISPDRVKVELSQWAEEDRIREAALAVAGIEMSDAVASYQRRLRDAERRVLLPWPGSVRALPADGGDRSVLQVLQDAGNPDLALPTLGDLAGSLWPGRLAVLVGGSGSGRTAFALQMAEAVAREGTPVLYASADLPVDEVVARLMVLRAATGGPMVPGSHVAVGLARGEPEGLHLASQDLLQVLSSLYIWNPTTPERTDQALRARATGVVAACKKRAPLVIVDPVEGFEDGRSLDRAYRELSATCRDLVRPGSLGPEWPGAAVLAVVGVPAGLRDPFSTAERLARASAEPGDRARLRERLTNEIGGLGTDAALLLALGRDPIPRDGVGFAQVAVIKNRHGHTGTVKLRFLGGAGLFVEVTGAR